MKYQVVVTDGHDFIVEWKIFDRIHEDMYNFINRNLRNPEKVTIKITKWKD